MKRSVKRELSKMSRKEPFGASWRGALLPAAFLAGCAAAPAGDEMAETLFVNARVYTVEAEPVWAEAVAVRDGRIIAVGASEDLSALRGEATRLVDLGGRLLMPAFGDAHVHPVFGGISYSRCSLHAGRSLADYQEIIAGCIADAPGDDVVYGVGWEDSLFPPYGIPLKEVLDEVSTERPLIFNSVGGHSYWVNSRTLEVAGITADTPDPDGGHIDRDPETGEPVGGLQESAKQLVAHMVPGPTPEEIEGSIVYVARLFNSLGITSWHDAGIDLAEDGSSETLAAYKAVKDRGELSAHVHIAFRWSNDFWAQEGALGQVDRIIAAVERAGSMGIDARSVKFYLDGVIPQRTAAMITPYAGSRDERGSLQIAPEVLNTAVSHLAAEDIQTHIHAIGDLGVRVALDAIEEARAQNGPGQRPMISHLNVINPDDQRRFGELGVIALLQPTWSSNYPYMDLTKLAIGPERSNYIYPANGVLKSGGMLAYGADWPVATADPILGLQVAVTRVNYEEPGSDPLLPQEAITLEEAVRAHTINVAYALGIDDITGSIAPGKSADLIVLDKDIFSLPSETISEASVILTLFEGRVVFGDLEQFE